MSETKRLYDNLALLRPELTFKIPTDFFVCLKLGMIDEAIPMLKESNPRYIEMCGIDIERVVARDMDWISTYLAANERKNRIALGLENE